MSSLQTIEPELKVTLTVPLIHTKNRSRKYGGKKLDEPKLVTRGFYVNIPKSITDRLGLKGKELIEITIKKIR